MEARPIWKWLALSCLLCMVIITCAVVGPKLTGQITNRNLCILGGQGLSVSPLWIWSSRFLPGLLTLFGGFTYWVQLCGMGTCI